MQHIEELLLKMEQDDLSQRKQNVDRSLRWRSIPRETGKFLYQMVMTNKPQMIVEIGLSQGYSALWMAMAAQIYGGHITSYEVEEWRYKQANTNIETAKLTDVISTQLVDSENVSYPGSIDFAFIDAEKSDYLFHFDNIHPKLNEQGIIIADNTLSHEDELRGYVETVRSHPSYLSMGLSLGKGLEFSRKIGIGEPKPELF